MSKASEKDKSDAPAETVRAGKPREGDPGSQDIGDGSKVGRGGVDQEQKTSS